MARETQPDKKVWAILQLQKRAAELSRIPLKEDFSEADRARIKAFLGPWPRALEAAGLKDKKAAPPKPKKRRKPVSQR